MTDDDKSFVSATEYTAFDIIGRVTGSKQVTDGVSYETGYVYNLAGAVVEETYPSGRKVKNTLDASGDLSMVQSAKCLDAALGTNAACINAAGLWSYARHFSYNAAGAVTGLQLGNGLWESAQFNSRLQPTQIALGATQGATNLLKLDYSYGMTNNNGNVLSQAITVPAVGESSGFVAVQTYNYDSLNRLKQAAEMVTPTGGSPTLSWKQTFVFDRYGNRNFDEASTTTLPRDCVEAGNPVVCESVRPVVNPSVNPLNNRFSTGQGWGYDAAGNVTADPQGRTFTYDAENKQVKVESVDANGNPVNTLGVYYYDGDGKRVKKVVPATGETTIFVYDASGRLVAEYSTIVANSADAKVAYLTNDHLGSPRINTDANGAVTARHDYHPFGEEIGTLAVVPGSPQPRTATLSYTTDTVRRQFTGYERDTETDLDFAEARFYGSTHGRFTSVDPYMRSARLEKPQSFNRYVAVLNNPLNFVDSTGMVTEKANEGDCPEGKVCDENGKVVEILDGTVVAGGLATVTVEAVKETVKTVVKETIREPKWWEMWWYYTKKAVTSVPKTIVTVGKGMGALGMILLSPTSTGCGASPGMGADGDGGCIYKPEWDFRLKPTSEPDVDTSAYPNPADNIPNTDISRSPTLGKKQNERRDTGFQDLPDEEIRRRARDRSLPGPERRKYQKEEKIRGDRNKQKRGQK